MLIHVPIRLRLTVWYVLLLAVILAAFSSGVYLLLRHALYQNLDKSIENRASALTDIIGFESDAPYLPNDGGTSDPTGGEHFARVFDSAGSLRSHSGAALADVPVDGPSVAHALAGESISRKVKLDDDDPMRVKTFPILLDGAVVGALEVGQSEDDVSDTLATLIIIMAIAYPVTLVVASLGGLIRPDGGSR